MTAPKGLTSEGTSWMQDPVTGQWVNPRYGLNPQDYVDKYITQGESVYPPSQYPELYGSQYAKPQNDPNSPQYQPSQNPQYPNIAAADPASYQQQGGYQPVFTDKNGQPSNYYNQFPSQPNPLANSNINGYPMSSDISPQSAYMPPQTINGNPAEQYTGMGYAPGNSPDAVIANLPQYMQDYYGARGVQNYDPSGMYTNATYPAAEPSSVSPYGNLGIYTNPYGPVASANTGNYYGAVGGGGATYAPVGGSGMGPSGSNYTTSYANGTQPYSIAGGDETG